MLSAYCSSCLHASLGGMWSKQSLHADLRCQCSCRTGRTCPSRLWREPSGQTCRCCPRSPPRTASPPAMQTGQTKSQCAVKSHAVFEVKSSSQVMLCSQAWVTVQSCCAFQSQCTGKSARVLLVMFCSSCTPLSMCIGSSKACFIESCLGRLGIKADADMQ